MDTFDTVPRFRVMPDGTLETYYIPWQQVKREHLESSRRFALTMARRLPRRSKERNCYLSWARDCRLLVKDLKRAGF